MAETVTLSVRRILSLHQGLNSLDAIRRGKDEVVPLEFSGATRSRLIANAVETEKVQAIHSATDRALAKQQGVYADMPATPENAVKGDAYRRAVEEALDEMREISIVRIKLGDLLNAPSDGKTVRLNPVMQSTLNRLAPILETE